MLPAGSPSDLRQGTMGYYPLQKRGLNRSGQLIDSSDSLSASDDYFALAVLIAEVFSGQDLWGELSDAEITMVLTSGPAAMEKRFRDCLHGSHFKLSTLFDFLIGGLRADPGFLIGLLAIIQSIFDGARLVKK
jgi:hypothetical protein